MKFTKLLHVLVLALNMKPVAPFQTHPNYLGMNIPYAPVMKLRGRLEKRLGHHLRNRGEAHITVVTPPEYDILKAHLSMKDIDEIARKSGIESIKVTPVCVGRGEARLQGRLQKTYYIVVKASELLKMRRKIHEAFVHRGGSAKAFRPSPYYPHITLGFTKRDLFESDGVIKDVKSCRHFLSKPRS